MGSLPGFKQSTLVIRDITRSESRSSRIDSFIVPEERKKSTQQHKASEIAIKKRHPGIGHKTCCLWTKPLRSLGDKHHFHAHHVAFSRSVFGEGENMLQFLLCQL